MKVLILCDGESADAMGLNLREQAEEAVKRAGGEVVTVVASYDELEPCLGCFGCWVKTPGLCVITKDGANETSRELVNAHAVVILSRLTYGGFSADVKAALDRVIPNISPFFETYRGEMHHRRRYRKFPLWIAVGYGKSTEEERQLFRELTERNALNMRPKKHFCITIPNADECAKAFEVLERILSKEVRV